MQFPYSRPARRKFNPFFFCQTCLDSGFVRFIIGVTQILKGSSQLRLGLKNEPIEKNKKIKTKWLLFFCLMSADGATLAVAAHKYQSKCFPKRRGKKSNKSSIFERV